MNAATTPSTNVIQNSSVYIVAPPTLQLLTKPKRQLTAYNFFFQAERKRLLEELPQKALEANSRNGAKRKPPSKRGHGKIGFAALGREIAARWKTLAAAEKAAYYDLAARDKLRFAMETQIWDSAQAGGATLHNVSSESTLGNASSSSSSASCSSSSSAAASSPAVAGASAAANTSMTHHEVKNNSRKRVMLQHKTKNTKKALPSCDQNSHLGSASASIVPSRRTSTPTATTAMTNGSSASTGTITAEEDIFMTRRSIDTSRSTLAHHFVRPHQHTTIATTSGAGPAPKHDDNENKNKKPCAASAAGCWTENLPQGAQPRPILFLDHVLPERRPSASSSSSSMASEEETSSSYLVDRDFLRRLSLELGEGCQQELVEVFCP